MSSSPGHPPETWAPPGDRLPPLRGRRFSLDVAARTRMMGVLNVTPDSFSDGGRYLDPGRAVEPAHQMVAAGAGLILAHMRGTPRTMQQDPRYTDLLVDVREHLRERILLAEAAGVHPEAIVVDPGVGFGESVDHHLLLLKCLPEPHGLKKPILVGPSRKSFIGRVLDLPVEERAEGTAAAMVRGARMTEAIRGAPEP